MNLIAKDPDFIWMPCVRWERKEDPTAGNCYNCPIVMSYPTALGLNGDALTENPGECRYPCVPYQDKGEHGIVLAGRPDHTAPENTPARPELIASFGFAVLTEDSVAHLVKPERPIRVVDQWMFHSRLCWQVARTTTIPRSTTPCPSSSRALGLRCSPRIPWRIW